MANMIVNIHTDGSANHLYKVGGWAAIILYDDNKAVISGTEFNTTHNRMELLSAIRSIQYVVAHISHETEIKIFTDSQYVVKLRDRKHKLQSSGFITKKGNHIHNEDLIILFLDLIKKLNISFIKVEAHSNKDKKNNLNRTVDMLARKIVREAVKLHIQEKNSNKHDKQV